MSYNKKITENLETPEDVLAERKTENEERHQIAQFLWNPGKMYIQMSCQELDEFFSKPNISKMKNNCGRLYSIYDIKRGILEANSWRKTETTIHIVDLMLSAVSKIENLQNELTILKNNTEKGNIENETRHE